MISLFILGAIFFIALIDFIPRIFVARNAAIPLVGAHKPRQRYTIYPTVYGDPSYINKFAVWFLKRHAKNMCILTTDQESPEFYRHLRKLCRETGARYKKVSMVRPNGSIVAKNAYTIYKQYFISRQVTRNQGDEVCVLIDADTYSKQSIRRLVNTFIKSEADMASLRCEIAQPRTLIEKLQAFEYKVAMDNRQMDKWLTSGACNMATARVYREVFAKHSEFFAGGDIEIGKIAQVSGFKVRHIDFTFLTLAPDTLRDWFNQRIIWMAGGFRHHVINIGNYSWHHLFMTFYSSFLLFILFPLRWVELINYPITFPFLVAVSWLYVYLFLARKDWHPRLLLLPAYSFVQTMIILPLAIRRYFKYARRQKSFGLLRFSFDHVQIGDKLLFSSLNISIACIVLFLGLAITFYRVMYWAS